MCVYIYLGFPGGASGKELTCQCKRHETGVFDPWVRKTPGGGHGNPLQHSSLENPMDKGAWLDMVHRVAKSWTRLKWLSTCTHTHACTQTHTHARTHTHTHIYFLQKSTKAGRGGWAVQRVIIWTSTLDLYNSMLFWFFSWRRQWHPTPVLLPGKSHGRRSLVGCSPWGRWGLDTTEQLHFHFSLSCIGEGNGNPLQCSCLENPRDGGAWWAAVYGVTQSWTWLKWLSIASTVYIIVLKNIYIYILWTRTSVPALKGNKSCQKERWRGVSFLQLQSHLREPLL